MSTFVISYLLLGPASRQIMSALSSHVVHVAIFNVVPAFGTSHICSGHVAILFTHWGALGAK